MKKNILLMIALIQCISLCTEEQSTHTGDSRYEKPYLYFKNMSDYPVTIIAANNQQITLRPNDYVWPFRVGYEPVTIIAHVNYQITITNTFSRESDDECRWNIHVYKPARLIRIDRRYTND